MSRLQPGPKARRAAARRLASNWTELHRHEEEAARSSILYEYVFKVAPSAILVTALLGGWRLARGETTTLLQLLALGAVALGAGVWAGASWFRRWRANRARVVWTRDDPGPE